MQPRNKVFLPARSLAAAVALGLTFSAFGTAAYAWTADSNGTASVGLVDTDPIASGIQGAVALQAGKTGQAIADLVLWIPNGFQAGDTIDLTLAPTTAPTNAAAAATFTSDAAVTVGSLYKDGTSVDATPVETGLGTATKPQISVARATGSIAGVSNDVMRLTIANAATSASKEMWQVKLTGLKVDLGASVLAESVSVTATAKTGSPSASAAIFGPGGNDKAVVGRVLDYRVSAPSGTLDDGKSQPLGEISIQELVLNAAPATLQVSNIKAADLANARVAYYLGASTSPVYAANVRLDSVATPTAIQWDSPTFNPVVRTELVKIVISGLSVTPAGPGVVRFGTELAPIPAADTSQANLKLPSRTAAVTVGAGEGNRVSGANRYATSLSLLDKFNPGQLENVVLVSGKDFPDALSATYLAQVLGARIVLTDNAKTASADLVSCLQKHGVQNVYIVGGPSVVSSGVESQLSSQVRWKWDNAGKIAVADPDGVKLSVMRLAGTDRYSTNLSANMFARLKATASGDVSFDGGAGKKTGIVVSGTTFADALAAGPLVRGAKLGGGTAVAALPIVLASPTAPGVTSSHMQALGLTGAVLVGGESAVPASVATALAGPTKTVHRVSGASRWATNAAVVEFMTTSPAPNKPGLGYDVVASDATTPFLVNGMNFADALAVGPYANQGGKLIDNTASTTLAGGQAIVLTEAAALPEATRTLLMSNASRFTNVVAVGGTGSVSAAVLADALMKANPAVARKAAR